MSHGNSSYGAWVVVTTLQAVMALAQGITALVTGSVALFAETLHLIGDVAAAIVGVKAERLSLRQADAKATFGYKRARDRSLSFRAILIIVLGFVALQHVATDWFKPEPLEFVAVAIWVAIAGLIVNVVGHIILERSGNHHGHDHDHHHDTEHDHRKIFSGHLLWDAASSLVAIAALSLVQLGASSWVDTIGGLAIGIGMIEYGRRQWKKRSVVERMLELTPAEFPTVTFIRQVMDLEHVSEVDHVHVSRGPEGIRVSICVHVDGHLSILETEEIRREIHDIAHQPLFDAKHIWIEFRPDAGFVPATKLV